MRGTPRPVLFEHRYTETSWKGSWNPRDSRNVRGTESPRYNGRGVRVANFAVIGHESTGPRRLRFLFLKGLGGGEEGLGGRGRESENRIDLRSPGKSNVSSFDRMGGGQRVRWPSFRKSRFMCSGTRRRQHRPPLDFDFAVTC